MYYLKLGGPFPTIGFGARFQKNDHGLDLSANVSSIGFLNYLALKGLFLWYPHARKQHQLYYGVGPGMGYEVDCVPMGQPFGYAYQAYGLITAEGVLGYEFRHARYFKTFIQCELFQPLLYFGKESSLHYLPGAALTVGCGF